jgi:hypothetical protein
MSIPQKIQSFYKKPKNYKSVFFSKLADKPNIFIIYKTIALVMVWAGIWGLLEEYVFPDSPTLRYISVLTAGLFLLYIDDGSLDELTDFNPNRYKVDNIKNGKE